MHQGRRQAFSIFFAFCALLFILFQSYHLYISSQTSAYLHGYGKQQMDLAWQDFKLSCIEHDLFLRLFKGNPDKLSLGYFQREFIRIEKAYYLHALQIRTRDRSVIYGSRDWEFDPLDISNDSIGHVRLEPIVLNKEVVGEVIFSYSLPFESLLNFQQNYLRAGSVVLLVIMFAALFLIKYILNHIFILEKQYAQSKKLAEFGSISAGVAHDIRNPLAIILLQAEALSDMHERDNETQEHLSFIKKNAKRINHTVSTLMVFQQENLNMEEEINLQDILIEAIENASLNEIKQMGYLKIDLVPVFLKGNRDLLVRMIENLLRNAYESHMTDTIEIKISGALNRNTYRFSVADSGAGVKDSESIFKPFFTTKNYGTGLGLQVVRDAAIRHGAEVLVERNAAGGTTFIVEFRIDD